MREYLALSNKKERREAHVRSHGVHISGNAWSAAAVLPPHAADYVLNVNRAKNNQCARDLLDALLECSPCLPAFALREDSRIWALLKKEHGVQCLKDWAASLGPLLDCNERAKRLLDELDELERYPFANICARVCSTRSHCHSVSARDVTTKSDPTVHMSPSTLPFEPD